MVLLDTSVREIPPNSRRWIKTLEYRGYDSAGMAIINSSSELSFLKSRQGEGNRITNSLKEFDEM